MDLREHITPDDVPSAEEMTIAEKIVLRKRVEHKVRVAAHAIAEGIEFDGRGV